MSKFNSRRNHLHWETYSSNIALLEVIKILQCILDRLGNWRTIFRVAITRTINTFTEWHWAQPFFVDFVWVETVDPNTLYPKPFERPSEYLSDKVETKTLWALWVTRSMLFPFQRPSECSVEQQGRSPKPTLFYPTLDPLSTQVSGKIFVFLYFLFRILWTLEWVLISIASIFNNYLFNSTYSKEP